MACTVPKSIVSVAFVIVLLATSLQMPVTNAVTFDGITVTALLANGHLWNSQNGNSCGGCTPCAGAKVGLYSNGAPIDSATAFTRPDGSFSIPWNGGLPSGLDISRVTVRVFVPVNGCPLLPAAAGFIEGVLQPVGVLAGDVLSCIVVNFLHVL